jgi:RNA polymerase sigma factor (sigma-70 family)
MDERASPTDAELLRASRRDPDAFAALYDRYARRAAGWAAYAGVAEADVLDVVAELFAQAWRSRRRFRDPGDGSAAAWLRAIVRHIAAHYHRRGSVETAARKRLDLTVERTAPPGEEPPARLDAAGLGAGLETALAALPPAQATAVRLRVVDELGYAEIGSRLSCTPVTARKHVSLGLRHLRGTYERETP